jgi:hypothetical protein
VAKTGTGGFDLKTALRSDPDPDGEAGWIAFAAVMVAAFSGVGAVLGGLGYLTGNRGFSEAPLFCFPLAGLCALAAALLLLRSYLRGRRYLLDGGEPARAPAVRDSDRENRRLRWSRFPARKLRSLEMPLNPPLTPGYWRVLKKSYYLLFLLLGAGAGSWLIAADSQRTHPYAPLAGAFLCAAAVIGTWRHAAGVRRLYARGTRVWGFVSGFEFDGEGRGRIDYIFEFEGEIRESGWACYYGSRLEDVKKGEPLLLLVDAADPRRSIPEDLF